MSPQELIAFIKGTMTLFNACAGNTR